MNNKTTEPLINTEPLIKTETTNEELNKLKHLLYVTCSLLFGSVVSAAYGLYEHKNTYSFAGITLAIYFSALAYDIHHKINTITSVSTDTPSGDDHTP